MKTIVALYDSLSAAERAVNGLHGEEVPPERISVVAVRGKGAVVPVTGRVVATDTGDSAGAAAGAAGVGSTMEGLSALTIPALGPVLALGPLGPAAAGGAHSTRGGLTPSLHAAGVPEREARAFVDALREDGGALVVALVNRKQLKAAVRALANYEPVDVQLRLVV